MGFLGGSKKVPPKKTYEQVFADLVKSLSEKANHTLSNPITLPAQPTLSDLEEIFKQITHNSFKDKFQYQFNEQATTPPSLAPGTRILTTFERFYKVDDDNKNNAPPPSTKSTTSTTEPPFTPIPDDRQPLSEILDDFKNQVIGLPGWVQDKAQEEIVRRLDTFFSGPGGLNDWITDVNTPVYDQSDKYANSVRLDAIFVRLSGLLEETEVKAELNTVYCIGIYYQVVSAAAVAKKELWKTLYVEAGALLNTPPFIPDNPDRGQLEALLIWYRDNKLFQANHGFPFKGTPDGLIDDLGRPTHLFIIEDDDFSKLAPEIEQSILSKINFPAWASAAREELRQEIGNLLGSSPSDSNGWLPVKYDKSPTPPSKDYPALLIKGNFVHCNLVSSARRDVTYRALYFCGVFYTAASAKETVAQELISAVYKTALRLVKNVGDPPDQPSRADLDNLLYQALGEEFQRTFGFAYDGAKTSPSDKVGATIYYGKVDFDSKTRDQAAATEATQAIISELKISSISDEAVKKSIYDDLFLKIKRALEADQVSAPTNSWNDMNHDREYTYSDESLNPLVGKAILYYCNGSVYAQNTTIQRSFIYFTGVFYEIQKDEW